MPNIADMQRQDRLISLWDALAAKLPKKAQQGSNSDYDPVAQTSQPGMDPYMALKFLQLGQQLGPLMGRGADNDMIGQLIQALLQGKR